MSNLFNRAIAQQVAEKTAKKRKKGKLPNFRGQLTGKPTHQPHEGGVKTDRIWDYGDN